MNVVARAAARDRSSQRRGELMRTIMWAAAVLLSAAIGGPAVAQLGNSVVSATSLFCRTAPDRSAAVVTQLLNGNVVEMLERSREWVRVRAGAAPQGCWVMEQFLRASAGGGVSTVVNPRGRRTRPAARSPAPEQVTSFPAPAAPLGLHSSAQLRRAVDRATRPTRPSAGGACPCSSSRNCRGPRGGRYCTTSGGNRRYR